MTGVEVLVTGFKQVELDIRSIEPALEEIIAKAEREIHVAAYIFTRAALHFLDLLEKAAERGVKISVIVNSLHSQDADVVSQLISMASKYPHVGVFDFTGSGGRQLHAKVVVADRKRAVVGSANLSWGGMYSNYEIGLLIEGDAAWKLAKIIDTLIWSSVKVS